LFNLEGKRALVTGASGAIGGAIVQALHRQGATVVLSGTRKDALEQASASLGERTHIAAADLSNAAAVDGLVPEAERLMGGLDILINNAGLTRDGLAVRMKDDDWSIVLRVNLEAAFRLARAALKGMMRQRAGRIIGISSVVGVTGNAGQANYAASKAGMIGMSKALAGEVASRGITVNCVAPGFIDSAMTDRLNEKRRESIMETIPAGRLGSGEEVAAAVVFLASEEAAYITGQTIHVNGGMAMI
jgi:3-oxoacyl-[acyl-carrier protein] reductase